MKSHAKASGDPSREIVGQLMGRHSTAVVLFHHAIAERLGLSPADHKCFYLLRERGPLSGNELAAITGLTSGAITGVVARLEKTGYLTREPDPHDGRKQILRPTAQQTRDIHEVLGPTRRDMAELLTGFSAKEQKTIARFLAGSTEIIYRHTALLRARELVRSDQT